MHEFLHERRIKRQLKKAEEYLVSKYKEPQIPPEVIKPTTEQPAPTNSSPAPTSPVKPTYPGTNAGEVRESRKLFPSADSETRYSLRTDSYDSESIDSAMRGLSSASASETLKKIEKSTDMSFADKMLYYMNKKGLSNSAVYYPAHVDRRLFSKILCDRTYKPSKDTCVALCLALRLTPDEANDLLSRAGYTLSHSRKKDVVIEYFFREGIYNLNDANEILYRLDLDTIGR